MTSISPLLQKHIYGKKKTTIISCLSLAPNLINPKKIREVLKTMWGSLERKITTKWLIINIQYNIEVNVSQTAFN